MSRVALVLNGLILTMIGVRAMLTPAAFLGQYGIELPSAMALAEARSIHGGGFGALAILMGLGLLRTRLRIPALSAAAFVMLGLALGRLVHLEDRSIARRFRKRPPLGRGSSRGGPAHRGTNVGARTGLVRN